MHHLIVLFTKCFTSSFLLVPNIILEGFSVFRQENGHKLEGSLLSGSLSRYSNQGKLLFYTVLFGWQGKSYHTFASAQKSHESSYMLDLAGQYG